MYGSVFWIEWLDRLDRVLTSAAHEVMTLHRATGPLSLAAMQRSVRQLTALTNDLRLLDRDVLAPKVIDQDIADELQKALDTAVFRLGSLTEVDTAMPRATRERLLSGIDAALRDSRYEAAMLLEPNRRRE